MKVPANTYRCPLNRSSHRTDPDTIKREGWREQHILVVAENDDRLDFSEREFVRQLGNRLYGGKCHG